LCDDAPKKHNRGDNNAVPLLKKNPYAKLEKAIGYRFRKRAWLEKALVHRSYRFENMEVDVDNQRLEFLGDAVIGFVTGAYLFTAHEDEDEGFLTSLRSQVTSGKALAELAQDLDLGSYIKLGKGEIGAGGHKRQSTLADALEAVIGAVYLDGGMKAVQRLFNTVFLPVIEGLSGDVWAGNPKGKLQEVCQQRWRKGPHYRVVKRSGPAHASVYTVHVDLPDKRHAQGTARNKQDAEADAAAQALKILKRRRRKR
jgi:ribonuclease III